MDDKASALPRLLKWHHHIKKYVHYAYDTGSC
jgi:hypothetical protein